MDQVFEQWIKDRRRQVAAALRHGLADDAPFETPLAGILSEATARPGKGYRPLLALAAAEAFGAAPGTPGHGAALRVAAATEYFHLASLVYDDLPAMDDTRSRRGAPSLHRALSERYPGRGEALAILAAHSLTATGFRALAHSGLPGNVVADLVVAVADAVGPAHMAGGQALDLTGYPDALLAHAVGTDTPRAVAATTAKTAALFGAAAFAGTLAALASDPAEAVAGDTCRRNVADAMRQAGLMLGQAYQLADDRRDADEDRARGLATLATECAAAVTPMIGSCLRQARAAAEAAWARRNAGGTLPPPLADFLDWMGGQCRT